MKTKNQIEKSNFFTAVLSIALLTMSACGSSPSTDVSTPKHGPVYPGGYLKLTYLDQSGVAQSLGTPLMLEGREYEEINVLQLPATTPTEFSVEIDLPESAVAKTKEEYFPELLYVGGFTDLIYRDEDLRHQDGQIVFTTKIVDMDEFMPRGVTSGELQFQLADDSGARKDQLIAVRFRKNAD
jgi:hypothetical protein